MLFVHLIMHLLIDIGNTRIKYAVSDGEIFLQEGMAEASELLNVLDEFGHIEDVAICATGTFKEDTYDHLKGTRNVFVLNASARLPFTSNYKSEGIGSDRLAVLAGAQKYYPSQNILILDAGTCLTADLLLKSGEHAGGIISPGIQLRLNSMHDHTANLPQLSANSNDHPPLLGLDTADCMTSGAVNGLKFEMEGIIGQLQQRYEHLHVILTGGSKSILEEAPKNNIFAHENLLLKGLDAIYKINKS